MNNIPRLTKESVKENKRFTSLIVLAIAIIAILFSVFVKVSRDAEYSKALKELQSSSVSSSTSVNSSGESKIESLLRMSKAITNVSNDISNLQIEAKIGFSDSDTGLKIDQTL
ncbi:MAG: hypothetical protein WCO33_02245 [bacterium]